MRGSAGQIVSSPLPSGARGPGTGGASAGRELAAASAVLVLAIIVSLYHLGAYGLWEPDEARYAEIAREMLTLRDFVTPHLDYVPYLEKPPLLYWLVALAMRVGGINEYAARLPNAIAAIAGIAAVYLFVRRIGDRRQAMLAATILATSALYAVMAQVLTTDMTLTATVTVALFALYLQWSEGSRWWLPMYAASALGVLTKGPIALVIPALAGGIFLTVEREWRGALRRFHVVRRLGLVTLIAAPWFIAVAHRQPDFLAFYFIGEHIQRFFERSYSHGQPIYYYVPVILGGTLPWSLFIPFIQWRALWTNPAQRFCAIAAATILVLFSIASAKLVPYILPALPFAAVALAGGLDEFPGGRDCGRLVWIALPLGLAAAGVFAVAATADRFASPNPALVRPVLPAAGVVLLAASLFCATAFWWRRASAGLAGLAIATTALLIVAGYGRLRAEPARSYASLGRAIAQRAPHARLICYPRYIQSLPFYTGRRVILVGAPTELAYGATHAPDGANYFFLRRADLLRLWNEPQASVLIVDRGAMPAIAATLEPFEVIAQDQKKIAVIRKRVAENARPGP